jgi:hypothetical protein
MNGTARQQGRRADNIACDPPASGATLIPIPP